MLAIGKHMQTVYKKEENKKDIKMLLLASLQTNVLLRVFDIVQQIRYVVGYDHRILCSVHDQRRGFDVL